MEDKNTQSAMKRVLTYDDRVIKKIAGIAIADVEGVLAVSGGLMGSITDRLRTDDETKGISAEVGTKQVALDLNVMCEYGKHVPELFDQVAERTTRAIREMTGLEVVEIDMNVEDVLSHSEFASTKAKLTGSDTDNDKDRQHAVPPSNQPQAQEPRVH